MAIPALRSGWLRMNGHDSKADVVVAAFRLEPQAEGGSAGPAVVVPRATPADARGGLRGVQIGVHATGQLRVIPVPAPLEGVAVHVVQTPAVGRVAADRSGPTERWP